MCSDGSTTAAQYRTDENDARNWQSTTGKANAATPDTANAPPCQPYNPYKPPDARNEHTREKMPRLNAPHNATDGQHGMTNKMMSMPQHCQLIDTMTRRLSACLSIRQTERAERRDEYRCPLNDTPTRGTQ